MTTLRLTPHEKRTLEIALVAHGANMWDYWRSLTRDGLQGAEAAMGAAETSEDLKAKLESAEGIELAFPAS